MVQIIDTSVAVKWFIQETHQANALEILDQILDQPNHFAVPELFYFELSHVFNRLVPSPNEGQLKLWKEILKLGIHRFSMTSELLDEIRYFQTLGLSGYDASYVGLAKILRGTWISFDAKAHQKIAHLKLSRLLS